MIFRILLFRHDIFLLSVVQPKFLKWWRRHFIFFFIPVNLALTPMLSVKQRSSHMTWFLFWPGRNILHCTNSCPCWSEMKIEIEAEKLDCNIQIMPKVQLKHAGECSNWLWRIRAKWNCKKNLHDDALLSSMELSIVSNKLPMPCLTSQYFMCFTMFEVNPHNFQPSPSSACLCLHFPSMIIFFMQSCFSMWRIQLAFLFCIDLIMFLPYLKHPH